MVPQYIPKTDFEKPKRFEGQTILFPTERSYPKLWIKKILVSGGEDKKQNPNYFYAKGEVHDISSDQRVTGQPLTVVLNAMKGGRTSLAFNALFDRRKDEPLENYKVNVAGIVIGDLEFGRSDFLPAKITQSIANVDLGVNVLGGAFDSNLKMNFGNIALVFDRAPKNDVKRIARDVPQGVKGFNVGLRLWNAKGPFEVAFTTDLDNLIVARTKKVIGDEIARLQNEFRAKVNQRITEKSQEFEQLFNPKNEEALARLKTYESAVNEKIAFVESKKKELEARIEQEKKKQAEGQRRSWKMR